MLKLKYVAYPYPLGLPHKELMAESPVTVMAQNFPTFSIETVLLFVTAKGLLLRADIGNWHCY
jgi:hypothetical protein